MTESWAPNHPFALGQTVYARQDVPVTSAQVMAALSPVIVTIRGHDAQGLWFGSARFPDVRFAARDFMERLPPVMPPLVDADDDEAA